MEKRAKYAKLHPEMSNLDLTKILSKKYKELPEKKKVGGGGLGSGEGKGWEQLWYVGQLLGAGAQTEGLGIGDVGGSAEQSRLGGSHTPGPHTITYRHCRRWNLG